MSKHYEKAVNIALRAQKDLVKALEPVPAVSHQIGTQMGTIIARLSFFGGLKSQTLKLHTEFEPVTEFMGEPIKNVVEVVTEYVTPGEADKAQYVGKVAGLYEQFNTLSPEALLHSYTSKEDKLLILGVAKKAGLDVTGAEELTVHFVEQIGKAIRDKATHASTDAVIEQQIKAINPNSGGDA